MDTGFGYAGSFVGKYMNYDRSLFVDEVMQECWDHKAEIAAEYPTWEAYLTHLQQDRTRRKPRVCIVSCAGSHRRKW